MKRYDVFILVILLLAACGPASPAATATPTSTIAPTFTPEPTSTQTPTPIPPLEGSLFFDMNGSGLQDEASFTYDSERLADPRQPLQPDLAKAMAEYVGAHPEIKDGDLVTIAEPGLSGFEVCTNNNCNETDSQGRFSIADPGVGQSPYLKITDPNEGVPVLEMRYINQWKKAVVIPAYEMNGVQVPEQNLNDTEVVAIKKGIIVSKSQEVEIGLMQGFLTLPYVTEDAYYYGISTYCDLDIQFGSVRNFAGSTKQIFDPGQSKGLGGTGDTHIGIDFEGPEGKFVVDPMGGEVNGIFANNSQLLITGLNNSAEKGYGNNYGHLKMVFVSEGDTIYRGQLTAINGMTNTSHPHIHYGFVTNLRQLNGKDNYVDPFMDLVDKSPHWEISQSNFNYELSEILIGSPGYWTVVNLLVFPY